MLLLTYSQATCTLALSLMTPLFLPVQASESWERWGLEMICRAEWKCNGYLLVLYAGAFQRSAPRLSSARAQCAGSLFLDFVGDLCTAVHAQPPSGRLYPALLALCHPRCPGPGVTPVAGFTRVWPAPP